MSIDTILEVIIIFGILLFILNYKLNVSKSLKVAAKFLHTSVKRSLVNGSSVVGNYKGRDIIFTTAIKSPNSIMSRQWTLNVINRALQVSTEVGAVVSSVAQPTKNTYLDGNKIFYKLPEAKQNDMFNTKSGLEISEEDLPEILDELVQAAEIVEKSASKTA